MNVPPPNPYGAFGPNAIGNAQPASMAACLSGAAGQFTVRAGGEVRVGRDPAQCPIALGEPRVSAVHALVKFEAGALWVRDEGSNNGTFVAGARLTAGAWVKAPGGTAVRFGPVEFVVRIEGL